MDPSTEEMNALVTASNPMLALRAYVGIADNVFDAFVEQLGGLDKVREIIFIPVVDWEEALVAAEVEVRPAVVASEGVEAQVAQVRRFKAREKGQVGMMRRYARLMLGLKGDEGAQGPSEGKVGEEGLRTKESGTGGADIPGSGGIAKRKFKLSSVIDQSDDQEVEALPAEEVRAAVKRYKEANDGLNPAEDEEATADQIQGMKVKLAHDVVPYADFGVLRPYGARLERALKFHAKLWDPASGDFVMRELPGPTCHAEWLRSWKVFSFIMVALGAVTRARLERYCSKVEALNRKYGSLRGGRGGFWRWLTRG